jgi:hypothetical protein
MSPAAVLPVNRVASDAPGTPELSEYRLKVYGPGVGGAEAHCHVGEFQVGGVGFESLGEPGAGPESEEAVVLVRHVVEDGDRSRSRFGEGQRTHDDGGSIRRKTGDRFHPTSFKARFGHPRPKT